MKLMAYMFLSLAVCAASAQHVQIGADDPNPCAKVGTEPNLHVPSLVKLKGRILDQTGAPYQNSTVELRRFNSERKQTTIAKAGTNSEGYFDLGEVKRGSYRLVAFPTTGYKELNEMWCTSGAQCFLSITLQAGSTEQPDSGCPIK